MVSLLRESLSFDAARMEVLNEDSPTGGKTLYMKGICMEGGLVNENGRMYPISEISKAVNKLNDTIKSGHSILGELDHPDDLKINLERACCMVESMWMDGHAGYGKLKIIPTPMGNLVKVMLDSGVKLGVSTRGSGEVSESTGQVSDFDIVTIDVVAQPPAPHAYPRPIYEGLLNMRGGLRTLAMSGDAMKDQKVQKYLKEEVVRLINDLKIGDR